MQKLVSLQVVMDIVFGLPSSYTELVLFLRDKRIAQSVDSLIVLIGLFIAIEVPFSRNPTFIVSLDQFRHGRIQVSEIGLGSKSLVFGWSLIRLMHTLEVLLNIHWMQLPFTNRDWIVVSRVGSSQHIFESRRV